MGLRKNMKDKRISLAAAAEMVQPGDMLALGGMTLYRRPMAFVRALLQRQLSSGEPGNLTLLAFTAGLESDLLVGSGMISTVRSCYFGLEIFGLAPMFTYLANRGEIRILEETEASLAFGLRAQMAGINFMPGRGWIGTDLPKLRPDVLTVSDPYSGEE
jgi:glutaconate CoA-transferase subunit A